VALFAIHIPTDKRGGEMSLGPPSGAPNPYAPPVFVDQSAPVAAPVLSAATTAEIKALFETGKNGAAWFYWVAGLSLVNSIAVLIGAQFGFALGLSVTQIADGVATGLVLNGAPEYVRGIVFGFNLLVLGMVAGCGWLSQKRVLPVFALGMVLYLLDGLLFLPFGDVISIGIHGFALWCMWKGFQAYRQLAKLELSLSQVPSSY
jgi:hypothetical protein